MSRQNALLFGVVLAAGVFVSGRATSHPSLATQTVAQGTRFSDSGRYDAATEMAVQQDVPSGDAAAADARSTFPPGREGTLIKYGHDLITETPKYAGQDIRADMSCAACHVGGGTKARGGSFLGLYAKFPQWNARAHRFIALQDRVAECFLYSMNGRPPAYYSREMVAMTAYIAFLSRGAPVGKGFVRQGFVTVKPAHEPDVKAGEAIYTLQCAACHRANGEGNARAGFPPLWGSKSFNDGAGMNTKMAAFVKVNMPVGREGSLTDQQAADVSAFVLSHPRPHFDKNRELGFPREKSGYF